MNLSAIENKKPKLLLVDDDEVFCQVLSSAMKRRGFDVQSAFDSETALKTCETQLFDYAVIDLRIGEESGLSLVQSLHEKQSQLYIVMLTGYASIATAVEAIKLGASQYLTKPADADEIIAAFGKTLPETVLPAKEVPLSPKRLEWEYLQKVLMENDGNISATARALNMHRRTLQRKLQKKPVKR